MDEQEKIRKQVWRGLLTVARPDSRFHWDFHAFIPDFVGSEQCASLAIELPLIRRAAALFAAPDNSLTAFREACLLAGKTLIVPTYGLGRGFLQISRADVPAGQESFAATLDGLERYAQSYHLKKETGQPLPEVLVSGASVLNRDGVRINPVPSYFELEWFALNHLGFITPATPLVVIVHDCQVVDLEIEPFSHSITADFIVTPQGVRSTSPKPTRPAHSAWKHLPGQLYQGVPLLRDLFIKQEK